MVKEMVAIHRVFIIHDDTVHGEGDGSHTMYIIVVNNEDTVYGYHLLHHVHYRRE
jgi:hypothetical protein